MQISNNFKNYTQQQLNEMTPLIHKMNANLQKATNLLEEQQKQTYKDGISNVVYIDTKIKAEFDSLTNESVPFDQVIAIYYEWHENLLTLVENNKGNFYIKKILEHVNDNVKICRTFVDLVKGMS